MDLARSLRQDRLPMSKSDLTQGPVGQTLFRLTAPMMMGVSSMILVSMIEIGFIGQLGTSAVAAVTFAFPVTMSLSSIALGISIGTSSVIARSVGSGDMEEVRRLSTHGLTLIAILIVLLSTLGWFTISPVFEALGATPDTLPIIHDYMTLYFPGTVLFTLGMVAGSIMRANGNATIPGVVMTIAALLNLALDPIFIFGWFGFPALGVQGAALAMILSRLFAFVLLLHYIKRFQLINLSAITDRFWVSTKRILHVGVPAMATQLIGPISAAIITRILASHGEAVVAGFGVAARLEAVAVMLLFALSGSIGPFVGQNFGANKLSRVRAGMSAAYRFCLFWSLFSATVLFFAAQHIVPLFESNPIAIETAVFFLLIVPWSHGLWGVLMMASASFNALGKPLPSTALSFMRMFLVNIPIALIANKYWGYQGVFVATFIANCLLGLVGYFWFKRIFFTQPIRSETLAS